LEIFDLIVSRDEEKTREGQVQRALRTLGVQALQAIVVADKLMDMKVAEKLGCMSMAITDKPHVNGDFKASSIKEILKILEVD
jgi:phosphoglycolate phosphatase-like HAD superfamily hydrolase